MQPPGRWRAPRPVLASPAHHKWRGWPRGHTCCLSPRIKGLSSLLPATSSFPVPPRPAPPAGLVRPVRVIIIRLKTGTTPTLAPRSRQRASTARATRASQLWGKEVSVSGNPQSPWSRGESRNSAEARFQVDDAQLIDVCEQEQWIYRRSAKKSGSAVSQDKSLLLG